MPSVKRGWNFGVNSLKLVEGGRRRYHLQGDRHFDDYGFEDQNHFHTKTGTEWEYYQLEQGGCGGTWEYELTIAFPEPAGMSVENVLVTGSYKNLGVGVTLKLSGQRFKINGHPTYTIDRDFHKPGKYRWYAYVAFEKAQFHEFEATRYEWSLPDRPHESCVYEDRWQVLGELGDWEGYTERYSFLVCRECCDD